VWLDRYECKQDEEYNVLYYQEGKWLEKDVDILVDVPGETFGYIEEDNVFRANASLVEYFLSIRPDLDKDVVTFLRSEDKYRYRVSYEYRMRAKRKKKSSSTSKHSAKSEDEGDDADSGQKTEMMHQATTEFASIDVPASYMKESLPSLAQSFIKGAMIVFETEENVHFGEVVEVMKGTLGSDACNAMVVRLSETTTAGVFTPSETSRINLAYRTTILPFGTFIRVEGVGYVMKQAGGSPYEYVNWVSSAVRKKQKQDNSFKAEKASRDLEREALQRARPRVRGRPFGYIGVTRVQDEKRRFVAHVLCG
jgi:hypothetical protein